MNGDTNPTRPRPALIGLDLRDARNYKNANPELHDARLISVAHLDALQGHAAPIYATPRARLHRNYPRAHEAARAVGAYLYTQDLDHHGYPAKGRIA